MAERITPYDAKIKVLEKQIDTELFAKEPRSPNSDNLIDNIPKISDDEARADGFISYADMWDWLIRSYGHDDRLMFEPINKMTLRWVHNA